MRLTFTVQVVSMKTISHITVLLATVLLVQGCGKDNDPYVPLPPTGGGQDNPFDGGLGGPVGVRMTFNGADVLVLEQGGVLAFNNVNGQTNDLPTLSYRYYLAGIYDADAKEAAFAVTKGSLYYEAPQVLPDAFAAFFAPGTRSYGPATLGLDGVELEYRDADGRRWATRCGTTLQPGSEFLITGVLPGFDGLGQKMKVAAAFTCTFYDCQSGATQLVQDGVLVLDFRDF